MIDGAFTTLVNSGVLGALVVIEGFAIWWLADKLMREKDARLRDAQELADRIVGALEQNSDTTSLLTKKIRSGRKGSV